jgi:hypothetical protein
MTVDAASTACCCGPQLPFDCVELWNCSTLQKFQLNYETQALYKVTGTSATGLHTMYENIATMSGSVIFSKGANPPISGQGGIFYFRNGGANFSFYNRIRERSFYLTPSCEPCTATYLSREVVTTSSASTTNATSWNSFLYGRCQVCCNSFTGPRYTSFNVGGAGAFTRTTTTFNQSGQGFPSTLNGSASVFVVLSTPDGCVRANWFPSLHLDVRDNNLAPSPYRGGLLTTSTGMVIAGFPDASGCLDIRIPPTCDNCQRNVDPSFQAAGCSTVQGDSHTCQQGFTNVFTCDCGFDSNGDGIDSNGCLNVISSYEQFASTDIVPL